MAVRACVARSLPQERMYQWGLIMVYVKVLATSVLMALTVSPVSAASYTFDLQKVDTYHTSKGDDGDVVGNTLTITESEQGVDLTGTFTGKYIENAGFIDDALTGGPILNAFSVDRHNNGLGVCNIGECVLHGGAGDRFHTVDGASLSGARTDLVEMAFFAEGSAVDVTLTSLTFGWIGDVYGDYKETTGAFEIIISAIDGSMIAIGDILAFAGTATITEAGDGGRGIFDIPDLTDNVFGIKAGSGGSWKLMAATVDFHVPEIPLPAAGWLMLAGIGSLVVARRRRES